MTNNTIVIAYDGSDSAKFGISDLARTGLPDNTHAVIVSTAEVWMPPPPSYGLAEGTLDTSIHTLLDAASKISEQGAEAVREHCPSWTAESCVRVGSPATETMRVAEEKNARLIVTGSHGRTGISRLLLGSVSSKVVANAPCSVRVARLREIDPDAPVRLVLGLDGSPGSRGALEEICRRAWPPNSEVCIVTAVGPFSDDRDQLERELDRVRILQSEAEEHLRAAGLGVRCVIKEEDPRSLIVREAEEINADCIFVGALGFPSWSRTLFGGVPSGIVPKAHCSVEVVRSQPE